jgi:hypothetical protein
MEQDLQPKPVADDESAEGEMHFSFHDPLRVVLYEQRKNEVVVMCMYVLGGKRLVLGWLPEENMGKLLRSSTYRKVRTPKINDRSEPTLFSLEMDAKEQDLQSRFLSSHPSVEVGTRILFLGKKPAGVQVLTIVNFAPVSGPVGFTRLELVVSNTHFGLGDEVFPFPDSTSDSQFLPRCNIPLIEASFRIGVDHATLLLREGQYLWIKDNYDDLFASVVVDATDPLQPLILQSKACPGTEGFAKPFIQRIKLPEEVTGVSLFMVNKSQMIRAILSPVHV